MHAIWDGAWQTPRPSYLTFLLLQMLVVYILRGNELFCVIHLMDTAEHENDTETFARDTGSSQSDCHNYVEQIRVQDGEAVIYSYSMSMCVSLLHSKWST